MAPAPTRAPQRPKRRLGGDASCRTARAGNAGGGIDRPSRGGCHPGRGGTRRVAHHARSGSRCCPTPVRPSARARLRWPPSTGAVPRWWSVTGRQPVGLPSVQRLGGPRMAGPYRRCPHRLDPVGHAQRIRHRRRFRRRRQRRQSHGRGVLRLLQHGAELWGHVAQDANGPHGVQASLAVGNLDGVERRRGPLAGPGGVRLQRHQRGARSPGGLSSPPTRASPPRPSPTSTGTGRTRSSRAATRHPGWPTGSPTRPAATCGCWAAAATSSVTTTSTRPSIPRRRWATSWPAAAVGIAFGTGTYYPGASDTNMLFATDSHCNVVWRTNLGGSTASSPAIGDIEGNGNAEVIEGVDTGSGGTGLRPQRRQRCPASRLAPGHARARSSAGW